MSWSNNFPENILVTAGTLWIYFRDIFMAVAYLYGKKFVASTTPLVAQLREELYPEPYNKINWSQARQLCAKVFILLCLVASNADLNVAFICSNIILLLIKYKRKLHKYLWTLLITRSSNANRIYSLQINTKDLCDFI